MVIIMIKKLNDHECMYIYTYTYQVLMGVCLHKQYLALTMPTMELDSKRVLQCPSSKVKEPTTQWSEFGAYGQPVVQEVLVSDKKLGASLLCSWRLGF